MLLGTHIVSGLHDCMPGCMALTWSLARSVVALTRSLARSVVALTWSLTRSILRRCGTGNHRVSPTER